jgi:hypothetical protein
MIRVILLFVLVYFASHCIAQDKSVYYEKAIAHISKDDLIKSIWISQSKPNRKVYGDYKKLRSGFSFQIIDTISPKLIYFFKDSVVGKRLINISDELVLNPKNFGQTYSFPMYRNEKLAQYIPNGFNNEEAPFIFNFSKPIENFLIGELWYKGFGKNIKSNIFGESYYFLFVFDEKDDIIKMFFIRALK